MSQHDPRDVRLHDDVRVVPHEMDGMAGLMTQQADHFDQISRYVRDECGDTSGLTGLMGILAGPVHDLADLLQGQYHGCAVRMDQAAGTLERVRRDYTATDEASAEDLRSIGLFDRIGAYQHFQLYRMSLPEDLTSLSYGDAYGDYWRGVDAAGSPNDNTSIKDLPGQISDALQRTQEAFEMVDPAKDLVALLAAPIVGDYDKLSDYPARYDNVGNASYQIAENIRRGHARIGPRWSGDGAEAFEANALMWNQGTGGLGDVAELCSQLFAWVYREVSGLVGTLRDRAVGMRDLADRILQKLWPHPRCYAFFRVHGPAYVACAPGRPPQGELAEAELADVYRWLKELKARYGPAKKIVDDIKTCYDDATKKANQIYSIIPAARTAHDVSPLFGPAKRDPDALARLRNAPGAGTAGRTTGSTRTTGTRASGRGGWACCRDRPARGRPPTRLPE